VTVSRRVNADSLMSRHDSRMTWHYPAAGLRHGISAPLTSARETRKEVFENELPVAAGEASTADSAVYFAIAGRARLHLDDLAKSVTVSGTRRQAARVQS
jgi:hypothetical protein